MYLYERTLECLMNVNLDVQLYEIILKVSNLSATLQMRTTSLANHRGHS